MTKISNLYTLTNYITANSSGNVVIAAPASGYALDVTGTGRFTGAFTGTSATFSSSVRTIRLDAYGSGTNDLLFLDAGVNTDFAYKIVSGADDAFVLRRQHNTQGGLDIMSWTYSGKVGIGTTSPTGLLHLYGADPAFRIQSSTTGNMQFGQWDGTYNRIQGSGRDFLLINTDATNILLSTNSSERMRITSGGNVGIGTTSPQRLLDARGAVNLGTTAASVSSTPSAYADIHLRTWAGADLSPARITVLDNWIDYVATYTDGHRFRNWSSNGVLRDLMIITGSGNVGIGTTSPSNILHAVATLPRIIADTSSQYAVLNLYASGSEKGAFYLDNTAKTIILEANGDNTYPLLFRTAGSERMRITSSGNVGIGTTSPSEKLHLAGASNNVFLNEATSGNYAINRLKNATYTVDVGVDASGLYLDGSTGATRFYSGATERMRISDVGSVSIGMTSSPYGRVAIKSNSATAYMGLNVYANGNANFTYMNHNNNVGIIGTEFGTGGTGHTPLTFQVGGTERLRINTNGDINFGITPSYDTTLHWRGSFDGTSYAKIWADGNPRFNVQVNGTGGVYVAAGGTSWTAASDERLKTDLLPIENASEKVSQLRAMTGRYKTDDDAKRRSFLIAQDVYSVLPEAVDVDTKTGMLGVQYTEVIPLLVASIKELSAKVTALENK